MRDQMLNICTALKAMDAAELPSFTVMKAIATHKDVNFPNPWETTVCINVDVNEAFVKDKELMDTVVEAYVHVLNSMYAAIFAETHIISHANVIFMTWMKKQPINITYK